MQRANITTRRNQDFSQTLRLSDSKFVPLNIIGALFYMSIKERSSGNMLIATLSNDDTITRQGRVYVVDAAKAKIKLFLQKEFINDRKYVNTWYYDLVMRQFNTYTTVAGGSFTILDAVTDVDPTLSGALV